MKYYLDDSSFSISDLKKRIKETDLVPSRLELLNNIDEIFILLEKSGIKSLEDLRKVIKNAKNIPQFSKKSGIDSPYLTLLRREMEGYFPNPYPLSSFDWLDKKMIELLVENGYKNSMILFEALQSDDKRTEIIHLTGMNTHFLNTIASLVNLVRIQWTSPLFARMLMAAGYLNSQMIAEARAEELCDTVNSINQENVYFKGKIGLRDIKRLIKAASYVPYH